MSTATAPVSAFPLRIVASLCGQVVIFDLAHTPEQAESKIARLAKTHPDISFSAEENNALGALSVDESELNELRQFKQDVLDNTGTTETAVLAHMARTFENLEKVSSVIAKREKELAAAEAAFDAKNTPPPAPKKPKPAFKDGDFVRDTHSGAVALISFDEFGIMWAENIETGERHTLPEVAAQYYEKLSKAETSDAEKKYEARVNASQPAPAPKLDAIAGESPEFPFGVGDTVRDIHTGALVEVTAVGLDAALRGFDWKHTDATAKEQSGSCPLNAVGNFELHGERKSAPRKK